MHGFLAAGFVERGVKILTLAGEDFVVIKSAGTGLEVPLADDGGLVAGTLHFVGEVLLVVVDAAVEGEGAVHVGILSRHDTGAAWRAD